MFRGHMSTLGVIITFSRKPAHGYVLSKYSAIYGRVIICFYQWIARTIGANEIKTFMSIKHTLQQPSAEKASILSLCGSSPSWADRFLRTPRGHDTDNYFWSDILDRLGRLRFWNDLISRWFYRLLAEVWARFGFWVERYPKAVNN